MPIPPLTIVKAREEACCCNGLKNPCHHVGCSSGRAVSSNSGGRLRWGKLTGPDLKSPRDRDENEDNWSKNKSKGVATSWRLVAPALAIRARSLGPPVSPPCARPTFSISAPGVSAEGSTIATPHTDGLSRVSNSLLPPRSRRLFLRAPFKPMTDTDRVARSSCRRVCAILHILLGNRCNEGVGYAWALLLGQVPERSLHSPML